ncbi:MAG: flagellar biosynthesis anti-sigma factor FlgM [Acidobacteriaceae bacterium]|nr:flagellar biosynthesis anti-sigma factor FlgM [Acidobacteriaceae bacterium]
MKIELASPTISQPAIERNSKYAPGSGSLTIEAIESDRTTLSSDSLTVQSLTHKALQTPVVRQHVVDAVKQQIDSGEYKVAVDKIAEGIIAESNE